jgi:hypothetical protein
VIGVVRRAAEPAPGDQQRPHDGGPVVRGKSPYDLGRRARLRPQDADQRLAGIADQLGVAQHERAETLAAGVDLAGQ